MTPASVEKQTANACQSGRTMSE